MFKLITTQHTETPKFQSLWVYEIQNQLGIDTTIYEGVPLVSSTSPLSAITGVEVTAFL